MARGKMDFSMDEGESGIIAGYISGIAKNVSTRRYIDGAVEFTTQELSRAFEQDVDTAARAASDTFYHVYNWGDSYGDRSTVGVPAFRLWKLVNMGSGKNRGLGFTFLPETRPTPIEPELLALKKPVNEGVHIFTWKAVVMEYGIEVEIRPKLPDVKVMAFVGDDGEPVFREGPIRTVPGYRTTTGVFSSFFLSWWTGVAPQLFEQKIRPQLEADVITNKDLAKVARQATRRRRKNVGVNVIDFRTGEAMAKKHMENNRIDYVRRAARRRMKLYGY